MIFDDFSNEILRIFQDFSGFFERIFWETLFFVAGKSSGVVLPGFPKKEDILGHLPKKEGFRNILT